MSVIDITTCVLSVNRRMRPVFRPGDGAMFVSLSAPNVGLIKL